MREEGRKSQHLHFSPHIQHPDKTTGKNFNVPAMGILMGQCADSPLSLDGWMKEGYRVP